MTRNTQVSTLVEVIVIVIGWELGKVIGRALLHQYRVVVIVDQKAPRAQTPAPEEAA